LSFLAFLVVGLSLAVSPHAIPADSEGEDKDRQIEQLLKRIEELEEQVRVLQDRVPRRDAGGNSHGLQEALALYRRIDKLVASGEIETARSELSDFNRKHTGTQTGQLTQTLTRELGMVGKAAPDSWVIEQWFQGESELSGDENRTTIVVFWEAWCPHCKTEMPRLQAIYDKHKDRGLMVLGLTKITRGETEDSVRRFIGKYRLDFPIAKEAGEVSDHFKVSGIPAAAVVKGGKIVWRGHPIRLTEEMLKNWL
jgi:thiol-disulfide isomerase/thioredoxin